MFGLRFCSVGTGTCYLGLVWWWPDHLCNSDGDVGTGWAVSTPPATQSCRRLQKVLSSHTWLRGRGQGSAERGGRRGQGKGWGFFSIWQFRFCFDKNPKIQAFLWNESAVGVGRAKSWTHGKPEAIHKFSLQFFPGFTYFLLTHCLNTSV